ncbi:TadE/TadG family type IV pilus assembly protein [Streptomyces acidiscabies]|uniref:TadE/TadG family type IV pilus assembly protein n=1 Tax=Streptomyces acidiscabies TaxID=42234 RepID=A0AAP6BJX1_9ACTN|nr:TadE/TadG family type IV pilus assembly protein [Streptomyces acidiscabies]MBP5937232.1 pilus assembly protein [Streptomyces sp. LBUM 1476]MBZ3914713.1 pilus assembly protein [Streptomyces acidiscabies]MDX2966134.1 TadE/TadG family type IV pilus assembly protein [Streptomyces acidiscabies]MDX3020627.1 TadE/TadG family type IV pilus assembly protein [Streptomyces acidiscabies]MDX3795834.1 TadE/TadG family type IV pilus assembly protein [Streptomyces acidiscabies]
MKKRRGDRGQVAIEYLGFLPILLLVGMAVVQLGIIAYAGQQAGTAARAGARSEAREAGTAGQACGDAVSSWLADGTSCVSTNLGTDVRVTSSVAIPSVFFGWGDFGPAQRTATMPNDQRTESP